MNARRLRPHRPDHDDRGFTLVELVVASALLGLAMTVIGSMMMSLFSTERTVSGLNTGTNAAQLTATAIDDRISQASSFDVTNVGADQLLVARVAGRDEQLTWQCYAWYFSVADGGSIRYTVAPDGTAMGVPSASALATWSELITGVSSSAGAPVFDASGLRLSIAFDADAGSSPPIAIRLTSVRLDGVTEASSCF
jgi:prepilin-type N-terminal cleavage/methylation domain-containing protein